VVPCTIVAYPIFFIVFPRIWHVCHKHYYITAGDFVRSRLGNRWLAVPVTITGIVATMPYIALQLVGFQVVIGAYQRPCDIGVRLGPVRLPRLRGRDQSSKIQLTLFELTCEDTKKVGLRRAGFPEQ
jgi:hypothetical protein